MNRALTSTFFGLKDYDLAATLNSGQVFRWEPDGAGWVGVIGCCWVRLEPRTGGIAAQVAQPVKDWDWLATYLQLDVNLDDVLATFPTDAPMQAAVAACRGLRLLRQEPWECLASFILSSNNQIRRIRQLISELCMRYGRPVCVPAGYPAAFAFPPPEKIASLSERELRRCKIGFRAPYLLAAARAVANRELNLGTLGASSYEGAKRKLLELPGVGPKIADCVLLFAYGFQCAFPIDVWVLRALREFYFTGRRPSPRQIAEFVQGHFGPFAGYAQQYLYHYMRMRAGESVPSESSGCLQHKAAVAPCRLCITKFRCR
jgi:N-glycosylase/DNA lyase